MTDSQNPGQPGNPPSNPGVPAPGAYDQTSAYGQPQDAGAGFGDPNQQTTAYGQPDQQTTAYGQPDPQTVSYGQHGEQPTQFVQSQQPWGQPQGQFPPSGPYPQPGFAPMPPGPMGPATPSLLSRLSLPAKLGALSGVFGVITFFMGFVAWVSIDHSIEHDAENWAADNLDGKSIDIPAFLSPSLITSPGWFFILMGAVGVAAFGLIATKWHKFMPYLAFLATAGWLGLLAAAFGLPAFIGMGAGAIVALIFGFVQAALLGAATLLDGLADEKRE